MATGVYVIRDSVDGKIYIGSTSREMCLRFKEHQRHLLKKVHCNFRLQKAWDMHGRENFTFTVLEECEPNRCVEREQWWMDFLCPELNVHPIAGSSFGYKHREEAKKRMSDAKVGVTPCNKGLPMSEEQKKKLRGQRRTKEVCLKISQSLLGRTLSESHKQSIAKATTKEHNPFFGSAHSEETKKKISEKKKAHYQKLREGGLLATGKNHHRYGRKVSEETKQRMRDAHKNRLERKKQQEKAA